MILIKVVGGTGKGNLMNLKKILFTLAFLFCFSSVVHGMDLVKDIVKNEVLPAATIIATGAALGAASNIVYNTINHLTSNQIYNFKSPTLKESILRGAALSLPIVLRARLMSDEPYPQISPLKFAVLTGASCSAFIGLYAIHNNYHERDLAFQGDADLITRTVRSDLDIFKTQVRAIQAFTAAAIFFGYPWMTR